MTNGASGANDLDSTLDALSGGLTSIDLGVAVSNLDNWQQRLENTGVPQLRQLAGDLATLKGHLASGDFDGPAIATLLQRIGAQTASAAAAAPADVQAKLQQLSQALTNAGDSLS